MYMLPLALRGRSPHLTAPTPLWPPRLSWLCMAICGGVLLWGGFGAGTPPAAYATEAAEVAYARGIVEYSVGRYVEALEQFRRAVDITPDNPDAQFYLGLTLSRLDEFAAAIPALEKALQLDAAKRYVHYPLGRAYLQEQRYQDALTQWQRAEQFDPRDAATQFYQGYTYYLLKQYNQASDYLARAATLDANLSLVAPYYRGLSLYEQERDAEAREALKTVLATDPDSTFGRNAQRYLEVIAVRERERRLVQVQGVISLQYDDNVILEPNAFEISRQADGRVVFAVDARVLPLRTSQWQAGAQYQLFQSVHFDLQAFNVQSHTLGLFGQYKLSPMLTARLEASYDVTLLDSHRFSESFTVQSSATIRETDTLFTVVMLRYRPTDYFGAIPAGQDAAVRDRDGWSLRTGFDQYWLFNAKRSYVRASYHFEAQRTDGSDWEHNGHDIGVGVQTPLWASLVLNVEGLYGRRDYLQVNSFAADPLGLRDARDRQARGDDIFTASVALTWEWNQYLALSAGFVHTSSLSNIAFFDYRRNIVTLALTGRY